MVTCNFEGTWTGDIHNVKATGKAYKVADADIFTVVNGKLASHRFIYPDKALFEQVGFDPGKVKK